MRALLYDSVERREILNLLRGLPDFLTLASSSTFSRTDDPKPQSNYLVLNH